MSIELTKLVQEGQRSIWSCLLVVEKWIFVEITIAGI